MSSGDWELRLRRWLSRHPRFKFMASAIRRRALPAWRRGSAADHWDGRVSDVETGASGGWLDSEFIEREYIRPQISGNRQVNYLKHFFDRHVTEPPATRLLSLGCGGGNLERPLIRLNMARHIDAIDGSPASIELAREMARREGMHERIQYSVQDINRIDLPRDTYDVVMAKMALHHFEGLEHIFEQVRDSLRPQGLLMFNEFVGPTRFQWTDLQLELMNDLLEALPEEIREKTPVARIQRPLLKDMIAQDPSESIRSAEIMPLIEKTFGIVELKPYGGTLLHIVLSHVLPLLDLETEGHRTALRLMMRYEGALIRHGVLPSDFVYCVARNRG